MSTDNGVDHWVITAEERAKHDVQFDQLKPVNGFLSGEQVKPMLMKSQLPKAVLGQIWGLADINGDGKLDRHEFSVAIHLIRKKMQKLELPKTLPDSLKAEPRLAAAAVTSPVKSPPSTVVARPHGSAVTSPTATHFTAPGTAEPPAAPVAVVGSERAKIPVAAAVTAPAGVISPIMSPSKQRDVVKSPEAAGTHPGGGQSWGIPAAIQEKYKTMFASLDKSKRGYLTGLEVKAILVQTKLDKKQLAAIWNLADIDGDGHLVLDEFIVAMYYVEMARAGGTVPPNIPPDIVPPSYRGKDSTAKHHPVTKPATTAAVTVAKPTGSADLLLLDDPFGAPPTELPAPVVPLITAVSVGSKDGGGAKAVPQAAKVSAVVAETKPGAEWPAEPTGSEKNKTSGGGFDNSFGDNFSPSSAVEPPSQAVSSKHEKDSDSEEEVDEEAEEQKRVNAEKGRLEVEKMKQVAEEEKRKREEEAKLAKEKAEQERLEKLQKEREAKIKLEKERQAKIEAEKEEQRKKVLEQKEAARREAEKLRQVEWERQRRDQLTVLKEREQSQLDLIEREMSRLKNQLSLLTDKKTTTQAKIEKGRSIISECTASIEEMRTVRDKKMAAIQAVTQQIENGTSKMGLLKQEQSLLEKQLESYREQLGDTHKTVLNGVNKKKSVVNALQMKHDRILSETQTRSQRIEDNNSKLLDLKKMMTALYDEVKNLEHSVLRRKREWDVHSGTATCGSAATDSYNMGTNAGFQNKIKSEDNEDDYERYTALYPFEARSKDELSLRTGDIVLVSKSGQSGVESGWMIGKLNNVQGCFPEAYVQLATTVGPTDTNAGPQSVLISSAESSFVSVPASASPLTSGQSQSVSGGLRAEALYGWVAKKDNHLMFNKGDIISIREQQDMWWSGELNGKVGWFPKSYVQLLDDGAVVQPPAAIAATANLYEAQYDYNSDEAGDLTFKLGQVIEVMRMDGDWWTGQLDGREGIFPAAFVKPSTRIPRAPFAATQAAAAPVAAAAPPAAAAPVAAAPIAAAQIADAPPTAAATAAAIATAAQQIAAAKAEVETTPKQKSKKPEIATVLASYDATGPEQLSLVAGQLVQIIKRTDTGWWEGQSQVRGQKRRIGWFPASFVKVLGPGSSARSSVDLTASPPTVKPADSTPAVAPPPLQRKVALYDYHSQQSDELGFCKGDIITVLSKDHPDWWKGEFNGKTGIFPSNFVGSLPD